MAVDAVIVGGVVVPAVLAMVAVALPAAVAGVSRRLVRVSVLLTLPIAISVLLVNLFFLPGGREVLFEIGPLRATREGLALALEVLVRLFTIAGAVTLFYLTTTPRDLVLDLERRGISPRMTFVVLASVLTVPAMVERAQRIAAAQRARGLNTEGAVWRRALGIVPLAAPAVLGALAEVDERTLALEARAFSRPGRRTLLWAPPDTPAERVARWALLATVPVLIAVRAGGLWPQP